MFPLFPLFPAVQDGLFCLPLFAGPAPEEQEESSSLFLSIGNRGNRGTGRRGAGHLRGMDSASCSHAETAGRERREPSRLAGRAGGFGDPASGGSLAATPRKELPPAGDRLIGKIEKTCDILDGQTLGQEQQGIGHAGLDDIRCPGVECLPQLVAVVVGEKHLGHHTVTLARKGRALAQSPVVFKPAGTASARDARPRQTAPQARCAVRLTFSPTIG